MIAGDVMEQIKRRRVTEAPNTLVSEKTETVISVSLS
jgi:hypothetical protein